MDLSVFANKLFIYIQGRFQDFQIEGVQLKFIF